MAAPAETLARTVLSTNLQLRAGESVVIETWPGSLPLVGAFVAEARRRGARPTVLYEDEEAWWEAAEHRRFAGFRNLSSVEKGILKAADVFVFFSGPSDERRWAKLPEASRAKMTAYNEEWYRVARAAGLRGCRMTVAQATDAAAARLGQDGATWRTRLLEAGAVPAPTMERAGARLARAIERGRELRLTHPNGTDLTVRLRGVQTRIDVGRLDATARRRPYGSLANNPSGLVMVAIDRSEAAGTIVGNRPVYIQRDRFDIVRLDGARWTLAEGRLVEYNFGDGAAQFEQGIRTAPKGAERMGYLSIGLNPRGRDLPPCEDTETGAVLIGVGRNAHAGGSIRVPFQGAVLVGGADVTVDGKPLVVGGAVRGAPGKA